ncbi:hypothetical protein [Phenylobacterium sp.]|uniref:hypothetical protein n=1 Tax=Phenylobacterium sp. TaxID=1871053 RepID=UPI0035B08AD7
MDLFVTLAVGAAMLVVALVSGWRGARPPDPHRGPRLVPWRLIMVTSAAVLLMMLVHAVNLLGVTTGH